MTDHLKPKYFASQGYENETGEYAADERSLLAAIKSAWPELNSWGDLPLRVAWGSYSQDVYLLSWLDESQTELSRENLLNFIAYIHWHDIKGNPPNWGITPEELTEYAANQSLTV